MTNRAIAQGQGEPEDAVSIIWLPTRIVGDYVSTLNTFLEQIGIRPGDQIYGLNEDMLTDLDMLLQTGLELLEEIRAGNLDTVTVFLQRGNFVQVEITVNLTN